MQTNPYASPKRMLEARGLRPRKRFGQNFLVDARFATRVAQAVPEGSTIIEIGGGTGVLTAALLERARSLTVLEIDRDLVPVLQERFAGETRVAVIEADALSFDVAGALNGAPKPRAICGNLPYNITTPLIESFVTHASTWEYAVLMVQREYAQRLTARAGTQEYGSLTVFVAYHCRARKLLDVGAGAFYPAPAVSSSIVVLEPLSSDAPRAIDQRLLLRLIRAAFAQRRKMFVNSVTSSLAADAPSREMLVRAMSDAGIAIDVRAERIPVEGFIRIADALTARGFALPRR
ncbi:MAG TPA: 16S rRNA (adenine(1518)-N(6)/adenine(1519)-N(6))-dimethyltransferase RsmA [Candidatus Eremiobacteraceae bacterium]|nr:16S rRNA (adenine(1518)-N(6)/adenine(1519)-N(6))-dimethyltransferase RsmA [Candidatus Eremiobacteraceae bacterium]